VCRRISVPTSRPIGPGCSSVTVSSGRWRPSARPEPSRTWRRGFGRDGSCRHCERSEAIHGAAKQVWIASSLPLLAMTVSPAFSVMFCQIPSVTAPQFPLWLAHRSGPKRAARGGRAMDAKTSESGHLMLITPERVFYAGLLGRPRERCPGALHVYVALKGGLWLTTADRGGRPGELLPVMPNVRHTIASEHRSAICLVIEPESVRPG